MVTIHPYHISGHQGLKISFSPDSENEPSLLICYNSFGDELMRMKLTGSQHDIDISKFGTQIKHIKIESSHSTVLKRILLNDSDD